MNDAYRPRLNIDALIFACNDLLIDVSLSYKEVVRNTVQIYLERDLGLNPSADPLITPTEIILLQKEGHFTNYWDLTIALVIYFIEMLPPVPAPTFTSKFHVPGLMAYLQMAGGNLQDSIDGLYERKDMTQFAKDVGNAGGGLDAAHNILPKINRHMLMASGSITKTNIVGRIFQEMYLGADLFEKVYDEPAIIVQNTGYAEHESLVVDIDILAQLSQKLPLGLVSDRPRREVDRSLKARKIDGYFKTIISADEIRQAKTKSIPSAWSLLEAGKLIRPNARNIGYVGANVGDIQAAKEANKTTPFTAIGCLVDTYDKAALRKDFEKYKASMILGHPNNLKELILG